jgi:hypothetical protein
MVKEVWTPELKALNPAETSCSHLSASNSGAFICVKATLLSSFLLISVGSPIVDLAISDL